MILQERWAELYYSVNLTTEDMCSGFKYTIKSYMASDHVGFLCVVHLLQCIMAPSSHIFCKKVFIICLVPTEVHIRLLHV